jgi:hypothetical protein
MASERRRRQRFNSSRIQHLAILLIVLAIVVSRENSNFSSGMKIVVDGVENPSSLDWTSNQKQLDVQSCCSYSTTVYVIALLPENWSLTWTMNATRLNSAEWANGTMTLQQTNTARDFSWTMNVVLE